MTTNILLMFLSLLIFVFMSAKEKSIYILGILFNLSAFIFNNFHFPAYNPSVPAGYYFNGLYAVNLPSNVQFLGDVFSLFGLHFSFGDILLMLSVVLYLFHLIFNN